jgi:hypothetical protein
MEGGITFPFRNATDIHNYIFQLSTQLNYEYLRRVTSVILLEGEKPLKSRD